MEEKNMQELKLVELEQVSGGKKVYNIRVRKPIGCGCGSTEWNVYGWSDNPRGYRIECVSCHARHIYDGEFWHNWN